MKCVPRDSVRRKYYIPKKGKQGKKIMSAVMGKSGCHMNELLNIVSCKIKITHTPRSILSCISTTRPGLTA